MPEQIPYLNVYTREEIDAKLEAISLKEGPVGKPGKTIRGTKGDQGKLGEKGTDGKDGRTILSGSGAPTANDGKPGDMYFDRQKKRWYGPKAAAGWGEAIELLADTVRFDALEARLAALEAKQVKPEPVQ